MSCTQNPEAVFQNGCWDLSQTRNLFFSTKKYKVNESLEDGVIAKDLAEFQTWQDFLESGAMLMLRVTVGEDTSTGAITGEIGGRQKVLGQGEARYSFIVETGCPFGQQLETFTGFSGGYLYYMNEGKMVGGILGETSGEVEPIKLNVVAPVAPKAINNGADINTIMIDVYFDAAQMFDMCVYQTKFRYTQLEQRLNTEDVIIATYSASGTNIRSDDAILFTEDYSGITNDGLVSFKVNDVEEDIAYTIVDNIMNILRTNIIGNTIEVTIEGDSPFWNEDYYGVTVSGEVE